MNEWQLQERLTKTWMREGVEISGDRHFLVAWEVMVPSWRINDAGTYWAEPSIDFLTADAQGNLTAVELKMKVPGRKPAWRVLCQVTHRAILLRDTFSPELVEMAHQAAASGQHGRVSGSSGIGVAEAHRRFFGLPNAVELRVGDIRRVVAAPSFGPRFDSILARFNVLSSSDLVQVLAAMDLTNGPRSNREIERLVAVLAQRPLPRSPVCQLHVG